MNIRKIPINKNFESHSDECQNDQLLDSREDPKKLNSDADQKDLDMLEKTQKEASEYLDALQRLKAEFDNFRKRMVKERCKLMEVHQAVVLEAILPALDSFDAALNRPGIDNTNDVYQGLKLIYDVLMTNLEKLDFHRMELINSQFDPEIAEALQVQQIDTVDPGTVIGEISAGYMFRNSVLRPARVVVSAAPEKNDSDCSNHKEIKTKRKGK